MSILKPLNKLIKNQNYLIKDKTKIQLFLEDIWIKQFCNAQVTLIY